jgi:hypothetical protein
MADEKKSPGAGSDVAAKGKAKKNTGKAKKKGARRVGPKGAWMPLEQATPAKSAQAMIANGRSAMASGRKARVAPEVNVSAYKPIHALYLKYATLFDERGMPKVVLQGAEQVCDQLSVSIEVDALSPRSAAGSEWIDELGFVHKLRESIGRLHPGPSAESTAMRAKFGIHEPVRPGQPESLAAGAKALLLGKKSAPQSRAAKLMTSSDEKRLRAIVQAVPKAAAEQRKVRADSVSRTTQRDILNAALELFYDDFAATAGMVLGDDEVARVQALQLIPRRPEQRVEKKVEGGTGSDGGNSTGAAPAMSRALVKA